MIPELHRPVSLDRIAELHGAPIDIAATPAECQAVAQRLLIPAVTALSCRFELTALRHGRPGEFLARGHLRAELVRDCVVTLEPFPTRVVEHFQIRFVPAGLESEDEDFESDDEIAYAGAEIDLGEATVEELALALDPYPRSPGATLPPEATDPDENPFAQLLGRRGESGDA